jgi:arylsulfatase A-like enzyme
MNAICLVIDRLHAGFLGAYGNAWIETPAFDRLASRSIVFDRALVDSPSLERLYRSYWQGWHALCPTPPESWPTLAAMLRNAGVANTLLTDEPQIARHPLAVDFDELIEIDPPWQPDTAAQIDQTHFARCFAQIIAWLASRRKERRLQADSSTAHAEPFLLWCHLGGLGAAWDAPLKFRQAYVEEGDPPPPESADVPDYVLPHDYDPDELLGITQSYAGQVALLDACLGALLEYLDGLPAGEKTLLAIVSARGFPLGEHLRVGPCDESLYGELVQVPWMVRFPTVATYSAEGARSQALVEPADLWATLLDWWGMEAPSSPPTALSLMPIVRGQTDLLRDRLCIGGTGRERAIRTPAWYLRCPEIGPLSLRERARAATENMATPSQLFAKPDDRAEVNNVASRCPEVVECLQDALMQCEQTLDAAGRVSDLPPLSEVLLEGLE